MVDVAVLHAPTPCSMLAFQGEARPRGASESPPASARSQAQRPTTSEGSADGMPTDVLAFRGSADGPSTDVPAFRDEADCWSPQDTVWKRYFSQRVCGVGSSVWSSMGSGALGLEAQPWPGETSGCEATGPWHLEAGASPCDRLAAWGPLEGSQEPPGARPEGSRSDWKRCLAAARRLAAHEALPSSDLSVDPGLSVPCPPAAPNPAPSTAPEAPPGEAELRHRPAAESQRPARKREEGTAEGAGRGESAQAAPLGRRSAPRPGSAPCRDVPRPGQGSTARAPTGPQRPGSSAPEARGRGRDLSAQPEVQPLLAAQAIDLRSLQELRSFRQPPASVRVVVVATALLLGFVDTAWPALRPKLDGALLRRIRALDQEGVLRGQERFLCFWRSSECRACLSRELCAAAAPLAAWCSAIAGILEARRAEPQLAPSLAAGRSASAPGPSWASGVPPGAPREPSLRALGGLFSEPDLCALSDLELSCVQELRIGRTGVGHITFHGVTDCRGLVGRLKDVLILEPGEVVVYPNQLCKPVAGEGLNKPASVVLYGCTPKAASRLLDGGARERYRQRVAEMTLRKGGIFEDYDIEGGTWKFRVEHF